MILALLPRVTARAVAALPPRARWGLVGAGTLLGTHLAAFVAGVMTTSLPAAVALVSLEPLAVVIAGWVAFGLRPTQREWFGVLLAVAGAALVALDAGEGENRLLGDALVVFAVALYGGYFAAARRLRDTMPVMPYAGVVYGSAFVVLAPFAVATAVTRGTGVPPPATLACLVALALVPTLVSHTLIQRSARHMPPAIVALVSPGETVGSIAIGAIAQHAWPTNLEWAGASLVVIGATVIVTARRS